MRENSDTLPFALEGEAPNSRASSLSPKNPTIAPWSPNLYPGVPGALASEAGSAPPRRCPELLPQAPGSLCPALIGPCV